MRIRAHAALNWSLADKRGAAGMTLVEVLIGSSIGLLVLGSLLSIVALVGAEQKRQLASATLQQQANLLEDKITRLIRPMSASQAVVLGNPIAPGSPFYRELILARGPSPSAREELVYQPSTFTCSHVPDLTAPSVQQTYFASTAWSNLRDMYFFISEKNDGSPDASAITVVFQLDDNGMTWRTRTNVISRSFTASMRNN